MKAITFATIDGLNAGTQATAVTWTYVLYVTGYALLLTTAVISIAVFAFQKRDVG